MPKAKLITILLIIVGITGYYFLSPTLQKNRFIQKLVDRNISARGGMNAWQDVSALRLTGKMDVGQGMYLPYILDQKRPNKMCLEFTFDNEVSIQCSDGKNGWKIVPFRGNRNPEPMTEQELKESADSVDLYGLLFDYEKRDHKVELLGQEVIMGRDTYKLKITLPKGAVRWLYIDIETALEVKLEAIRTIAGKERLVETFYQEWELSEGLLMAHRQETKTEGDKNSHFLTIETVSINPPITDNYFKMPEKISNK